MAEQAKNTETVDEAEGLSMDSDPNAEQPNPETGTVNAEEPVPAPPEEAATSPNAHEATLPPSNYPQEGLRAAIANFHESVPEYQGVRDFYSGMEAHAMEEPLTAPRESGPAEAGRTREGDKGLGYSMLGRSPAGDSAPMSTSQALSYQDSQLRAAAMTALPEDVMNDVLDIVGRVWLLAPDATLPQVIQSLCNSIHKDIHGVTNLELVNAATLVVKAGRLPKGLY